MSMIDLIEEYQITDDELEPVGLITKSDSDVWKKLGNWTDDEIQKLFGDIDGLFDPTVEIKCECGGWITYGRLSDAHSDWCPARKGK